jgi:hypothetical protein
MAANTRAIDRNEDEDRDALAAFALDKGAYPWDVI